MFKAEPIRSMDKEQRYKYMLISLEGQLSSEENILANLSNASAIINAVTERINWCGFYILKDNVLILGPFQGLPACNRIKAGTGVCGTAIEKRETIVVKNVHEFEGHIACDSESKSEIVVPIIKDGVVYGVLDIDSPEYNRFSELDKKYFEMFVEKLNKYIDWKKL